MFYRKCAAICFVFTTAFGFMFVSDVEAQLRDRNLGFTNTNAKVSSSRPVTTTAFVSGRCAQLHAQAEKLQLRKATLLNSRDWPQSQLREIAHNFGNAENNLATLIQRCEQN